jgi:hypothetical protein
MKTVTVAQIHGRVFGFLCSQIFSFLFPQLFLLVAFIILNITCSSLNMLSSVLTTAFALFLCANAGNIELDIQPGLCNIYEKSPFVNVSQIIKSGGAQDSTNRVLEAPKASESPKPKNRKKLSTRWTTKPSCLSDEEGQEYCVFTNKNFANGRGISFFTTPTIAENVKDLPAFQQMGVHDDVNNFSNPPWEVRNIPGRGNGLFATRKLERGDLILADTPLGVYLSDAFFPDYELGYRYLRKTYDQLPEDSKNILLRTAAHNPGDMVMERINTNAFAGEFEGLNHFFLYPETAVSLVLSLKRHELIWTIAYEP